MGSNPIKSLKSPQMRRKTMKIKHLITELEEYNPEAEITTPYSENICLSYISKDSQGNELNKQTTMQVFIEWSDSTEEV